MKSLTLPGDLQAASPDGRPQLSDAAETSPKTPPLSRPTDLAAQPLFTGDDDSIQKTLYGFIMRHSWRQQILVLAMTLASFPFLYYSLDLPKTIVNIITKWDPNRPFSIGFATFHLNHLNYLWALCGLYFTLVLINGGFKYWINRYKGQLGERMLRRLRYALYERLLRFPVGHFKRVSPGEIIPMITSEVEPLGGFIGDAFALPAFQGGTLITTVLFMFLQDPILGAASISLYPIQGYLIPKLQRRVNLLGKARVRTIRKVADRVNETSYGIGDILTHDNGRFQLASFAYLLGTIYDIRFEIYQRKFFVKFLNNTLNALTPFFFFSVGGYLVIRGQLSAGSLVAVLAAYKDLAAPWKELLDYYQSFQDTRIKYDQVVEQFEPSGMLDRHLLLDEPETPISFSGSLVLNNVTLIEDGRVRVVDGVGCTIPLDRSIAVVGSAASGKQELATLLARLIMPSSGRLSINDTDMSTLPAATVGRHIAYVPPAPYLFTQSLGENLLASLQFNPVRPTEVEPLHAKKRQAQLREAHRSGNIEYDIEADWVDFSVAGVKDREGLSERLVEILQLVGLDEDVYLLGLRGHVSSHANQNTLATLLEARKVLHERLAAEGLTHLVEPFDANRYNTNASVAENLLFGTPVGPAFLIEGLANNTYVHRVLDKAALTDELIASGAKIAEIMVELFADGAPSDEFVAEYSFISSEDLPVFQSILTRAGKSGLSSLHKEDRTRLLSLPLKIVVARHRLGVIDEALQERVVAARRIFAADLPDNLRSSIEFFAMDRFNAAASIQDNILFGKLPHGEAEAEARLITVVAQVINELNLRRTVIEAGLEFQVGPGGSRLPVGQRHKVALARALLKRPQLLIVDETGGALDGAAELKLITCLKKEMEGKGLAWILGRASFARQFDFVLVMEGGRLVEQGSAAELNRPGTKLSALIATE